MLTTNIAITLTTAHDMRLVVLSILIAVLASYTALDLAGQVTAARGQGRQVWLLGGATAMGVGIWSMHFIAMLAFSLPIPIGYDVPVVMASMVAAIVASAIALFVVSRERMATVALLVGGALMGGGVGVMHYTGMAAMRLAARITYDPLLFAASVLIAVVVSTLAMWLAFHLREERGGTGALQKLVSALVMGGGIAGLHYTAMAAARFAPIDAASAHQAAGVGNAGLALGIAGATAAVLALALLGAILSRRGGAPARAAGAVR